MRVIALFQKLLTLLGRYLLLLRIDVCGFGFVRRRRRAENCGHEGVHQINSRSWEEIRRCGFIMISDLQEVEIGLIYCICWMTLFRHWHIECWRQIIDTQGDPVHLRTGVAGILLAALRSQWIPSRADCSHCHFCFYSRRVAANFDDK